MQSGSLGLRVKHSPYMESITLHIHLLIRSPTQCSLMTVDYVSTTIPVYHNNLFLGNFNLHVSNIDDTDSAILNDSIDAIGLYQHMCFSIHKLGNILNLILSNITDNLKVLTTAPGSYLIDHRAVIATLNVKTLTQKPKVRTIRKVDKVVDSEWTGEFNPKNIPLTYKLDTELTHILDKLAPEKECKISTQPKDLQLSGFADDHSIRSTFKAADRWGESSTITSIEKCMLNVKKWMDETHLKMNPLKTEFIYFGFNKQFSKCTIEEINIAGDLKARTNIIKYLGVWMDSALTYKTHAMKKCKATMLNFIHIRNIRHLLSTETTESLVLSLCVPHIDHCNALLYRLPDATIN